VANCEAAEENLFRGLQALILFSDTATDAFPLALFLLALSFAYVLSDSRASVFPPIVYSSSRAVLLFRCVAAYARDDRDFFPPFICSR